MGNALKYGISDRLYASDRTILYRAVRTSDDEPVILKILNQNLPGQEELGRFRREYEITRLLKDIEGVINFYEFDTLYNANMIVMEDIDGQNLFDLKKEIKGNLELFFEIAVKLTSTLQQIHKAGLIHKDINPTNVLWSLSNQSLRIIDFGIAVESLRENGTAKIPDSMEGTLLFLSPEQTGRVNRPVDHRSDLYSVGATLYFLITGVPPFESNDLMELVHAHLARSVKPAHLIDHKIPETLSSILSHLLAKNAEERYQSCDGLLKDLLKCKESFQNLGYVPLFKTKLSDIPEKFQLPHKLYGREKEFQILKQYYTKIADGSRAMTLLSGVSGIGKSALAMEMQRTVLEYGGYMVTGKSEQFLKNTPYHSIVQAIRHLIKLLLTENDQNIFKWKERILDVLGSSGKLICNLIPELTHIIGEQPDVPWVLPTDAKNRFLGLFNEFIRVFPCKEHPLVIFLDDLHWADLPTLQLIENLMNDPQISYLYIIGAVRNNLMDTNLRATISRVNQLEEGMQTIHMNPLEFEHIKEVISDSFHTAEKATTDLARVVYKKTEGNPFFIKEFINRIYRKNLIRFNLEHRHWEWQIESINNLSCTTNIMDLMTLKIHKLPTNTLNALRYAACVGYSFDLLTLSKLMKLSPMLVGECLWPAIIEGLITSHDDIYKFIMAREFDTYVARFRFLHDRIHQAAYQLLSDEEKSDVHYRTGRILFARYINELDTHLFDIVYHLNAGKNHFVSSEAKCELAQLNLLAGVRALNSVAASNARKYLQNGLALLPEQSWEIEYQITLDLYTNASYAAHLSGDYEEMNQLHETIHRYAKNILDRVKASEIQISSLIVRNLPIEAVKVGREMLELLGIRYHRQPTKLTAKIDMLQLLCFSWYRNPHKLAQLPQATAPDAKAALRLLSIISPAVYIAAPLEVPHTILSGLKISVKYGNSPHSAFIYATYAYLLSGFLNKVKMAKEYSTIAKKLISNQKDATVIPRVLHVTYNFSDYWYTPVNEIIDISMLAFRTAREVGNIEFSGLSLSAHYLFHFQSGRNLHDLYAQMLNGVREIKHMSHKMSLYHINIHRQAVLNLISPSGSGTELEGEAYKIKSSYELHKNSGDLTAVFRIHFLSTVLCFIFCKYDEGYHHTKMVQPFLSAVRGAPQLVPYHFFSAMNLLALYDTVDSYQKKTLLKSAKESVKIIKKALTFSEENSAAYYHLLQGEMKRVTGNDIEAARNFETSIQFANRFGQTHIEAIANECAAKFHIKKSNNKIASFFIREALNSYRRWGAEAKIKDMYERYGSLIPTGSYSASEHPAEEQVKERNSSIRSDSIDMYSILKASQAISNEIILSELLVKLMDIVIENAGANRGMFLVEEDGSYFIQAESESSGVIPKVLQSLPLETNCNIPHSVINYVARTKESVVLNNVNEQLQFASDPYLSNHPVRSILALPIYQKERLNAILYLENSLTYDAFSPQRIEVLNILLSQVTACYENAKMYQTMEKFKRTLELRIMERTQRIQEAYEKVRQAKEKAEEATRLKDKFISLVSHDLKTPLYGINLMMDAMDDDNLDFDTQKNMIGHIQTSCTAMLNMIEQLLNINRLQTGKIVPDRSPTDMRTLMENLIEQYRPLLDKKNLRCRNNIEADTIFMIDKNLIREVASNLLSNAIKFSHQGGSIDIDHASGTTDICFKDNGTGISSKIIPDLFEYNIKTVARGTSGETGTGLGLPLCREIIHAHRGEIKVESEQGKGTKMIVEFPSDVLQVMLEK